jgi:hypothetical protein
MFANLLTAPFALVEINRDGDDTAGTNVSWAAYVRIGVAERKMVRQSVNLWHLPIRLDRHTLAADRAE